MSFQMHRIYKNILKNSASKKKLLAVLIDPDKMKLETVSKFISKVNQSIATHIFIGGSIVAEDVTETVTIEVKKYSKLPVILFPGDVNQVTDKADGILYLSLISGRNPDYLIGKHVASIEKLSKTNLEIIPTGYILIQNGKQTAVQTVTNTNPMPQNNRQAIVNTAKAGEYLGMKLIYLEAGSGAMNPINPDIIKTVKANLDIPLIVGGGIKSKTQLQSAYNSGADLVVIGTAFEDDESFFNELKIGR